MRPTDNPHYNVPSTPTTSRSPFMRYRRSSSKHIITFLRKEGIAKELQEFVDDQQPEMQADTSMGSTSQMTTDDSGIDVSQENGNADHSHFLRKKKKIAYY